MSFNPDPYKQVVELTFSRKNININCPVLYFGKTPVLAVLQHEYVDTKLSFSAHIQAAITTSRKTSGMLTFMSKFLPRRTLDKLYKSYVKPHLDYGDFMYHIPESDDAYFGNYQMVTLGTLRGISKEKLYKEIGWESLAVGRWYRHIVFLYKFTNNLTLEYTRAPIPSLNISDYSSRAQLFVRQLRTRI